MQPSRAHTPALPPILLVGSGRVGGALARAGGEAGLELRVAGRENLAASAREVELALLCVPDAEIENACAALAAAAPRLRFVGHTSGAIGLDALASATASGPAAFSLHPLQTVPDAAADLLDAPAGVTASTPEALTIAVDLAEALGMRPFELPEKARVAYHAAASIASNFLFALGESATDLLADAGIDGGRELLGPLMVRSAANWAASGAGALTGPIARGDEITVARHLEAITETSPSLAELYRVLAERTREIAAEREGVRA